MDYTIDTQRIKRQRISNGMTLRDLGRIAGISYVAVCNVESGKTLPHQKTIRKICEALEIPLNEIYRFSR